MHLNSNGRHKGSKKKSTQHDEQTVIRSTADFLAQTTEPTLLRDSLKAVAHTENTSVYSLTQEKELREQVRREVSDIILAPINDNQTDITKVKDLHKLRIPVQSPDPSIAASTISPEMYEQTVIDILDIDISEASPEELRAYPLEVLGKIKQDVADSEEITYIHPKYVEEELPELNLLAISASSEEKTGPGLSQAIIARRKAEQLADFRTPEIVVKEMPFDTFNDFDLMISEELSFGEFLQKKSLHSTDVNVLFDLVQKYPDSPELWNFISRMAKDPYDVAVLKSNTDLHSPKLFNSILVIGPTRYDVTDPATGHASQLIIYGGTELDRGQTGKVDNIYFGNTDSLKLEEKLLKKPINDPIIMQAFMMEVYITQKVQEIIRRNTNDPRIKNILCPDFACPEFIVMPKITNELGESINLSKTHLSTKFNKAGEYSIAAFCRSMAGAVNGLAFLSEHGIIVSDNKPQNIVDSKDGGVVIDLGGFVDKSLHKRKFIKVWKLATGGYITSYNDPNNPEIRTTLPITEQYGNEHLVSQEILGQVPAELSHKLSVAKIIEKIFCSLGYASHEYFKDAMKVPANNRINHPAMKLDENMLTPDLLKLYQLFLKLYHSYQHQYEHFDNNPQKGKDPGYISLTEAAATLNQIANNSAHND